ncbi:MAG: hypothetical protein J07HR59_00334 [Halorubrum sp. J07HR59]|nr:MAG: hypothetical protein J07HR59_00334 [Halorubrum sp. J07HR59]
MKNTFSGIYYPFQLSEEHNWDRASECQPTQMSVQTSFLEELLNTDQISYGDADREERSTDWGTTMPTE